MFNFTGYCCGDDYPVFEPISFLFLLWLKTFYLLLFVCSGDWSNMQTFRAILDKNIIGSIFLYKFLYVRTGENQENYTYYVPVEYSLNYQSPVTVKPNTRQTTCPVAIWLICWTWSAHLKEFFKWGQ